MANPSESLLSRCRFHDWTPQGKDTPERYDRIVFESPSDMIECARTEAKRHVADKMDRNDWTGLGPQPGADFLSSHHSTEAHKVFQSATAKLEREHRIGGPRFISSPAGGAWIIPQVLNNHPLPSRVRPREKLAPKNIKLKIIATWNVNSEAIARYASVVARALWDYQMAGGIVSLTLVQFSQYNRTSPRNTVGFWSETYIPLTNESAIATAVSVPLFRICWLSLAQQLSPCSDDGIPIEFRADADTVNLSGRPLSDEEQLRKHGFTIGKPTP